MNDGRTFRLRVTYALRGRLAMLSHLEVARTLERMVRRAGLPFAVTQGFSPHMKIAFGSALPVGVGGEAEIFDLYLSDYVAPEKALAALQESAPEDMMPFECRYIEGSAPAASVAYPLGRYEARLSEAVDELVVPETMTVTRKKKERTIAVSDHLRGDVIVDGDRVTFALESLPTGSLRPDVFLNACLAATFGDGGDVSVPTVVSVTRIGQLSASE